MQDLGYVAPDIKFTDKIKLKKGRVFPQKMLYYRTEGLASNSILERSRVSWGRT